MRAPVKASCRWSWRSSSTCCRGWPDAELKCHNWAAASAHADRVKLNSKPTGGKSTVAFGMLRSRLRVCGASGRNSASAASRFLWRTVALVGYTNAGKSTLFNALTRAAVLESPKMFATFDPTIRGITLPSRRKVLLSDTVGFIRHLPHTLVSAFRATLEEVQRADTDFAGLRRQQSALRRAGCASREGFEGTRSRYEATAARDE